MLDAVLDFVLTKRFISSVKVVHVFAWVSWMVGMLYLPRLFVYHSKNMENQSICSVFTTMETRLYSYIMTPAMLGTIATGSFLTYANEAWRYHWWQAKIALVVKMIVMHFTFGKNISRFKVNKQHHTRYYRIINEVPAVIMLLILIAVIIKPYKSLVH